MPSSPPVNTVLDCCDDHELVIVTVDVESEIGVYLFIEIYSSHNLFAMRFWQAPDIGVVKVPFRGGRYRE